MTIPQVMWLFEMTSIYNSLQHFLVASTGISSIYYIGQSSHHKYDHKHCTCLYLY